MPHNLRPVLLVLALSVLSVSVLSGSTVATAEISDDVNPCSNGTTVNDPAANPLLVQDCIILLNARDTLSGSFQLNWTPDRPLNQWEGVTIGNSPLRVVEIRLDQRDLSGRIPPELGRLTGINVLSFRINSLKGRIPPELGALSELRSLDLHGNSLIGSIPKDLANLTNLEVIDLHANKLEGTVPAELGRMSGLRRLMLSGNDLRGSVPPELGNLPNLEYLALYQNDLTGSIPGELGNLSNLDSLALGHNRLTGTIPTQLGQLRNLFSLNLQFNELTGEIPQGLANLTKLDGLILRDNQLTGEIPSWISEMSNLSRIQLNNNRLRGALPAELGKLRKLSTLYLSNNELTGTIPAGLGALNSMTELTLSDNSFSGEIPPDLGRLSRLEVLTLRNNELSGAIPAQLGGLTNLKHLSLRNNELTGPIPPALANLSNLRWLVLSENRLSGTIPVELTMLSELRALKVDENFLTGSIPLEFTGLTRLEELDVQRTGLTGCIPWLMARNPRLIVSHDGLSVCPRLSPIVREGDTLFIDISDIVYDTALEDGMPIDIRISSEVNCRVRREDDRLIFIHDGSETTTASFDYSATAGTVTVVGTVNAKITPVNDPPQPVTDHAETDEGNTIAIEASTLLKNDTDAERDSLSVTAVSDARNGHVSLRGSSISYKHDGSETTTGSFAYTVSDGALTNTGRVMIDVRPVNDPPVAATDITVLYEGGRTAIDWTELVRNDVDADGDVLSISAVGEAVNGKVRLEGSTVAFEHDGSETTEASFTYTLSDGAATDTAVVVVIVTPVNDPPTAASDSVSVDEGGVVMLQVSELLRNDVDPDSDSLSIEEVGDAVNGKVRLEAETVIFEHDGSEASRGSFTYSVGDGTASDATQVVVDVKAVNDPPTAAPDAFSVEEGGKVRLDVSELLRNDYDVDNAAIVVTAVGSPLNGVVRLDGMTVVFEHDGSKTLDAGFSYTISDGKDTATGLVAIAVEASMDAPVKPNGEIALTTPTTGAVTGASPTPFAEARVSPTPELASSPTTPPDIVPEEPELSGRDGGTSVALIVLIIVVTAAVATAGIGLVIWRRNR